MKIAKKLLLLFTVLCVATIYSCKKDSSTNQGSSTTTITSSRPAYEKRWNISTAVDSRRPAVAANTGTFLHPGSKVVNRPAGIDTSYTAIEFLLNSYIVFYTDGTVQVGQYSATNDTTLVLDSLGTIQITSLDPASFSFILILSDGSASVSIKATAAQTIGSFSTPSDSALISNTWEIDSTTLDGVNDSSLFYGITSYAIFSAYGTYLVRDVSSDGTEYYSTNTWLWTNSDHDQLCYGNWDGQNVSDCDGLHSVKIVSFSPPYSQLILQETDTTSPLKYYLYKQ
jgi:hypothetical protein